MKIVKAVFAIICLLLFIVFAIQNISTVDFNFLKFQIRQMPLFAIIVVVFVLGFIVGRISGWFSYLFQEKREKKAK